MALGSLLYRQKFQFTFIFSFFIRLYIQTCDNLLTLREWQKSLYFPYFAAVFETVGDKASKLFESRDEDEAPNQEEPTCPTDCTKDKQHAVSDDPEGASSSKKEPPKVPKRVGKLFVRTNSDELYDLKIFPDSDISLFFLFSVFKTPWWWFSSKLNIPKEFLKYFPQCFIRSFSILSSRKFHHIYLFIGLNYLSSNLPYMRVSLLSNSKQSWNCIPNI